MKIVVDISQLNTANFTVQIPTDFYKSIYDHIMATPVGDTTVMCVLYSGKDHYLTHFKIQRKYSYNLASMVHSQITSIVKTSKCDSIVLKISEPTDKSVEEFVDNIPSSWAFTKTLEIETVGEKEKDWEDDKDWEDSDKEKNKGGNTATKILTFAYFSAITGLYIAEYWKNNLSKYKKK